MNKFGVSLITLIITVSIFKVSAQKSEKWSGFNTSWGSFKHMLEFP